MEQLGAMTEFFINVMGQSRADAEHNAAKAVMQGAYGDIQGIKTPELQLADLYEQGGAGINGFTEDARTRNAQMKALDGLTREVDFQGMTPEDAQAYNRSRQAAGSMDAGFRGAAEQQAAQRGMSSSIGAYAGALSSGQAATNRASAEGTQAASDSRQRYLQALEGLSGAGSAIRGQDFGIASQRAQAQDAINRFNVGQKSSTQAYNLGVPQQDFENQMGLGGLKMNSAGQMADELHGRGNRATKDAAKWGAASKNFLGGLGGGGGGGGGMPF
jgi:hypothetical protein